MVQDSLSIMDERSLMEYFGHGVVNLLHGLQKQLPPSLQVQVDPDAVLGAISYQPSDGTSRLAVPPWALAPGRRLPDQIEVPVGSPTAEQERADDTCSPRKQVVDDWIAAHTNVRQFFPELSDKWTDMRIVPWNLQDDASQPPPLIDQTRTV